MMQPDEMKEAANGGGLLNPLDMAAPLALENPVSRMIAGGGQRGQQFERAFATLAGRWLGSGVRIVPALGHAIPRYSRHPPGRDNARLLCRVRVALRRRHPRGAPERKEPRRRWRAARLYQEDPSHRMWRHSDVSTMPRAFNATSPRRSRVSPFMISMVSGSKDLAGINGLIGMAHSTCPRRGRGRLPSRRGLALLSTFVPGRTERAVI